MRKNLFQFSIPYWPGKRLFIEAYSCDCGAGGRMLSISFWSGRKLSPAPAPLRKQFNKQPTRLAVR